MGSITQNNHFGHWEKQEKNLGWIRSTTFETVQSLFVNLDYNLSPVTVELITWSSPWLCNVFSGACARSEVDCHCPWTCTTWRDRLCLQAEHSLLYLGLVLPGPASAHNIFHNEKEQNIDTLNDMDCMISFVENSRKGKKLVREGRSLRVWIGGRGSTAKGYKETASWLWCGYTLPKFIKLYP